MVSWTSFCPSAFDQPGPVISVVELVPGGPQPRVVVRAVDRRVHGGLEGLVRRGPGRAVAGLPHRLLRVRVHPVPLDRAGPDQGLGQEVAEGPVRDVGRGEELLGERAPSRRASPPARRAGPGRPRRAWCRGWTGRSSTRGWRAWRAACSAWNSSTGIPNCAGVAAHLVQGDEPGVAVVGGVLDPLGHRRAAELLHPPGQLVAMDRAAGGSAGPASPASSGLPLARPVASARSRSSAPSGR